MMSPVSRHDHFPRVDAHRRRSLREATAGLDARWRADDASGLIRAMEAVADAPPAVVVAALAPWLADVGWLRERLDEALALLAADAFARPPLPMLGGGEGAGGLVLAERGHCRLSLQLHPFQRGADVPARAVFIPGLAALRVLASGGATIRRHHVAITAAELAGHFTAAGAARCRSDRPRPLVDDERLIFDTTRESFTLAGGHGDVLLLELSVQPPSQLPIRTYDPNEGALIHVSASRRDSSFRQMALALLRTLGRTDAAPLFLAETESEDFATRWSAMRELVALDPPRARPRLVRMAAADPHPDVRRAAESTLTLFASREAQPCPA